MTGYFTAANRIGTLAAVEVGEQLCSMAITMMLLSFWAGHNPGRACLCVVLGSSLGSCLTLICLILLRLRQNPVSGPRIPIRHRLMQAAVPLALADILKSGISTTENLMVPKRLALNQTVENPLAAFGMVSGMVFPVLMFPACILFGLAELLIPELARCTAAGQNQRTSYLVRRSLKVTMFYGLFFSGPMFLLAQPLCERLYQNTEASQYLKLYSLLIPMLYCDAITDAMTKGLGQQKVCVRYNILTSSMDVVFLYYLLPKYGMDGYFVSFLVTHLINFLLSLRRLLKISGVRFPFYIPALSLSVCVLSLWASSQLPQPQQQCIAYILLMISGLYLSGVLRKSDVLWFKGLFTKQLPCQTFS